MTYYIPSGSWPLNDKPYELLMNKIGYKRAALQRDADFLLLPGGIDIGINIIRDAAELADYTFFKESGRLVIGICRGLQFILSQEGGTLITHIPDVTNQLQHTTITGHWQGDSSWHTTRLGFSANSRHHQGFLEVPPGWNVLDSTSDGIVEAAACGNGFGVQWHPEHPEMNNTKAQDWFIWKLENTLTT